MAQSGSASLDTPTGAQGTGGSSETNKDEAEAIKRSMDISLKFWGQSESPPEKIPAVKLKNPRLRSSKASIAALKIWESMSQRELDKIKEIEIDLMREGEVETDKLFQLIKSITEGAGLGFEEMLKSIDKNPLDSTITLTNEILHIYNQNEPPEIVEEEDAGRYQQFLPLSSLTERSDREKEEISKRMSYLLKKAERYGLSEIDIPSSPFLSERSKLELVEQRVNAKMRVKNVQQAFMNSKENISFQRKSEAKKSALADRPQFRTAVKTRTLRYQDMIKNAPDLRKRIKKVREMKRKLSGNSKSPGGESATGKYNFKNHYYARPSSLNRSIPSLRNKSFKSHKISSQSPKKSYCRQFYDSDDIVENTFKSDVVVNKIGKVTNKTLNVPHPSRESMLAEMKNIVKQAVQEVARSNTIEHLKNNVGQLNTEIEKQEIRNDHNPKDPEALTSYQKQNDEMHVEKVLKKSKNDTVVTVTQETGLSQFPPISGRKDQNKVSTKIKVSKSESGPVLKVSVTSKLAGNGERQHFPQKPRSPQQNIQDAINVLKDYIALGNNENLNGYDGSGSLLISGSEEIDQRGSGGPDSSDGEEPAVPSTQAYTVSVLTEGTQALDPLRLDPLRPGWLMDEGGDVGDISTWNSVFMHARTDEFFSICASRRESDSLFVNASEGYESLMCVLDGVSSRSAVTTSEYSITESDFSEGPSPQERYFIPDGLLAIYRFFTGSILRVVFAVFFRSLRFKRLDVRPSDDQSSER